MLPDGYSRGVMSAENCSSDVMTLMRASTYSVPYSVSVSVSALPTEEHA